MVKNRAITGAVSLIAALTLGASLSGCGSNSASATTAGGDKVVIAVAGLSNLHNVPLVVARSLGYYKDEGVNVELQDLQAGSRALEALMSGSAQAAASFYDHTLDMQAKHQEVTAWITLTTSPGAVLVVPPKHAAEVTSVSALKGHPIGVSAPGSAEDQYMAVAFHRVGMTESDVSKVSIGTGSSAVAAMEKGSVYAAWLFEPAFSQFVARDPGSRVLIDTRSQAGMQALFGNGGYAAETLYSQNSWLSTHQADARKVDAAVVKALHWMSTHTAAQIAEQIPATLRGADKAAYVKVLSGTLPIYTKNGAMPTNGYVGNVELLKLSQGYDHLQPTKTFTNEYLPR